MAARRQALAETLLELFPNTTTPEAAALLAARSALVESTSVLQTMPHSLDPLLIGLAILRAQEALQLVNEIARRRSDKHVGN